MNTKDNQRYRLTERLFHEAYLNLMQQGPTGKITVKALCEQAELNRTTFYLHYNEPNDILKQLEDELIEDTLRYLDQIGIGAVTDLEQFLRYIHKQHELFHTMLVKNDNPYFARKFMDQVFERIVRALTIVVDPEKASYVYGFILNGSLKILTEWMEQGYREPEAVLADLLSRLCAGAIESFVTGDAF